MKPYKKPNKITNCFNINFTHHIERDIINSSKKRGHITQANISKYKILLVICKKLFPLKKNTREGGYFIEFNYLYTFQKSF